MLTLQLALKTRHSLQIDSRIIKYFKKCSVARPNSSLSYCVNLVKNLDYENYLCTIMLPDNLKSSAFAIRALNIEMSRIPVKVTESNIMPMRFKFWEECLNDIYIDKIANHPVLIQLSKAIKRHNLTKSFLIRLITTRANQLDRSTFKDLEEMEKYADYSNSPVYMLLLEASGIKNIDCDHVAAHLGKAQGLVNLIRGLPYNIEERLIMLPATLLVKYDVSEESLLRMTANPSAVSDIVFHIAQLAKQHINITYSLRDKIPSDHRAIFLPVVAIDSYLQRLESVGFNVFDTKSKCMSITLPISLWWKKVVKNF